MDQRNFHCFLFISFNYDTYLVEILGKITSFVNNFKPEQFELDITVCTFNFHQIFETTSKTYTLKVAFLLTGHYSRSRSWCSSGKGCVP